MDAPEIKTWKPSGQPAPHYPKLRQYLEWLRLVATVTLGLSIAAAIILVLAGAYRGSSLGFGNGLIAAAVVGVGGLITFLWSMATIETICVLLDIERNTRER